MMTRHAHGAKRAGNATSVFCGKACDNSFFTVRQQLVESKPHARIIVANRPWANLAQLRTQQEDDAADLLKRRREWAGDAGCCSIAVKWMQRDSLLLSLWIRTRSLVLRSYSAAR
jgi:hypothetical protein